MYNLMIVEGEPLERKALNLMISRHYKEKIYLLDNAKNGKEAITKAIRYKPDIILMGIGLPELNGICAQKEILQYVPNVQTVIITVYSDFNHVQNALKAGVVDYLLKPVDVLELTEAIDKVLLALDTKNNRKNKDYMVQGQEDVIDYAVSYIHKHYRNQISLKTLADKVHLNPQYFSRLFKKRLDMSYIEYINNLRIKFAMDMLVHTKHPIYRIAMEAGFSDTAYFSRVFHKYTGKNPSNYRNQRNK